MLKNLKSLIIALVIPLFFIVGGSAFAQDQGKVIIAIGEITSTDYRADPKNFQTMLETQLIRTNKFVIIERSRLGEILREQGLSAIGIADGGFEEIGGISGVDYLVYGAITKIGEEKKGTSLGIAGLNTRSQNVEMSVDLRIVDVETGEIVLAKTVERSTKSGGDFAIGGYGGIGVIGTSSQEGDPVSDIQRIVAVDIGGIIATSINPIKVAAVQGDGTIILNYGDSILYPGQFLKAFELGEGFLDPDTGEVLGAEETMIGVVEVTEALDKFSKGMLVEGTSLSIGTVVRVMDQKESKKYTKAAKKRKKKGRKIR